MARSAASDPTGRTRSRGTRRHGPGAQERGRSGARPQPAACRVTQAMKLVSPDPVDSPAVPWTPGKKVSRATGPGGTRGTAPGSGGLLRIRAHARRPPGRG